MVNKIEYRQKQNKFNQQFIDKFFLKELTEKEKMILVLEKLENDISPYSFYWRIGFKKYIKKAISLLNKMEENENESISKL